MSNAILIVNANKSSRQFFGHTLDLPRVKARLPHHQTLDVEDVFISDAAGDTLSSIRLVLGLGVCLSKKSEASSTVAIVQESILKNVSRPFEIIDPNLDERIFVVSQYGKVTTVLQIAAEKAA